MKNFLSTTDLQPGKIYELTANCNLYSENCSSKQRTSGKKMCIVSRNKNQRSLKFIVIQTTTSCSDGSDAGFLWHLVLEIDGAEENRERPWWICPTKTVKIWEFRPNSTP